MTVRHPPFDLEALRQQGREAAECIAAWPEWKRELVRARAAAMAHVLPDPDEPPPAP